MQSCRADQKPFSFFLLTSGPKGKAAKETHTVQRQICHFFTWLQSETKIILFTTVYCILGYNTLGYTLKLKQHCSYCMPYTSDKNIRYKTITKVKKCVSSIYCITQNLRGIQPYLVFAQVFGDGWGWVRKLC